MTSGVSAATYDLLCLAFSVYYHSLSVIDHEEDGGRKTRNSQHHMYSQRNMFWGTSTFQCKRRRPKTQECVRLPSIILIGPFPNSAWILCRHAESTSTATTPCFASSTERILCYDSSIFVTGSNIQVHLEPLYHAAVVNSGDHGYMTPSDEHNHVALSSLQSREIDKPTCIAKPKTDSQVALSIVLTLCTEPSFASADSMDRALLLSALKRQLVGIPVGFSPDNGAMTTTVSLNFLQREWKYTVKSVLSESQSSWDQPSFFWILPSTRITLEWDVTAFPPSTIASKTPIDEGLTGSAGTTTLSSASQQLVSVIHCMFRKKNGNFSRSFVLTGPPGVGKTHAVRSTINYFRDVNRVTQLHLISLHGSEVMSVGQASEAAHSLERHFHDAAQLSEQSSEAAALVFVDECEALMADSIMAAMLAYLLDKVTSEWSRVIFVGATNRVADIPNFLRRPGRLDKEIPLATPNTQERMAILSSLLQCAFDEDTALPEYELRDVAERCVGFVPADLDLLVRQVVEGYGTESLRSMSAVLKDRISAVGASALRDSSLSAPPRTSWNDIAGDPGGAKSTLRQAIEWPRTKRGAFEQLGLSAPRGILLYGPPGCAKSSLARAAAAEASVAFLSFSPADVYASSYVGDAEAIIRRGFALARSAAPCILFFDELDSVVGFENHPLESGLQGIQRGRSAEARVLSTFLNEMDGVDGSLTDGVIVLGATNRPWTLDAALLRPGRFDKVIYVPPPDRQGRRSILEMQCKNWQTEAPFDYDYLASDEISGHMTGAEIVGACRDTATTAMNRILSQSSRLRVPVISQREVEVVLRKVNPLLSNRDIMKDFIAFQEDCAR